MFGPSSFWTEVVSFVVRERWVPSHKRNFVDNKHTMYYDNSLKYYQGNNKKNERLRIERGVSFEEVVFHIERGDLLDVIQNPNMKYQNQKMFVINIHDYVYWVPFVEGEKEIFLKTIIPSRKATKQYLKKNGE